MSIADKIHLPIAAMTGVVTSAAAAIVYFDPAATGTVGVVAPLILGLFALLAAQTPAQFKEALQSAAYEFEQAVPAVKPVVDEVTVVAGAIPSAPLPPGPPPA